MSVRGKFWWRIKKLQTFHEARLASAACSHAEFGCDCSFRRMIILREGRSPRLLGKGKGGDRWGRWDEKAFCRGDNWEYPSPLRRSWRFFLPFPKQRALGNVNKNYDSTLLWPPEKKMESCELVCYVLVSVGAIHSCKYRSHGTILHNKNSAFVQATY